jgi:hypothetical protein
VSSSLSVASGGFVAFPNNSVAIESISGLVSYLAAKAPLVSPSFTGTLQCENMTASGATTFNADVTLQASAFGGSRSLAINAPHSAGVSSLRLTARDQMTGALATDGSTFYMESQTLGKELNFRVINASNVQLIPLRVYASGVVNVGGELANNKLLVIKDNLPTENITSGTNFYGFGVNGGTLRYQAPAAANFHRFYTGTTLAYTITNTGGANGSDVRFKTELQPIEHALQKISQLHGRTFKMYDNEAREMGFVAQEVLPVVPEVVFIDESDENRYHSLKYDKLTALLCEGIKELLGKVTALEARVVALEANPS